VCLRPSSNRSTFSAEAGFAGVGRYRRDRNRNRRKSSCLREAERTSGDEWRRRESNPRSEQLATDSEEDPDLATADARETASEPPHKQGNPDPPFIDPGQLTVFDVLDGSNDA
jgi:hypothetical protein